MHNYLIILRKKGIIYSAEQELLYLPTTDDEINHVLLKLGCNSINQDYEVMYTEFGYEEIDRLACDSDINTLNKLAHLLVDFLGTPCELCAEIFYLKCKDITDVISHLEHRRKLYVIENIKNIYDAGEMWFMRDFQSTNRYKETSYELYIRRQLSDGTDFLQQCFVSCALEKLRFTEYRFTPYGLVYEDGFPAPKSFDGIVLPF